MRKKNLNQDLKCFVIYFTWMEAGIPWDKCKHCITHKCYLYKRLGIKVQIRISYHISDGGKYSVTFKIQSDSKVTTKLVGMLCIFFFMLRLCKIKHCVPTGKKNAKLLFI